LVRNGEIITPGFDQDILEGITRDSILTIARNLGIRTIERPVDKSELFIAEEVFISGTAARLVPVKKIENYNLPKNTPLAETLRKKLMAITENRDEQYRDWVTAISI